MEHCVAIPYGAAIGKCFGSFGDSVVGHGEHDHVDFVYPRRRSTPRRLERRQKAVRVPPVHSHSDPGLNDREAEPRTCATRPHNANCAHVASQFPCWSSCLSIAANSCAGVRMPPSNSRALATCVSSRMRRLASSSRPNT